MYDVVRRVKPYIPTLIGGVLGAFIMQHRKIILDVLQAVTDPTVARCRENDENVLVVDEDLLREVRENGAILVYKYDDFKDDFAIIHDPDRY